MSGRLPGDLVVGPGLSGEQRPRAFRLPARRLAVVALLALAACRSPEPDRRRDQTPPSGPAPTEPRPSGHDSTDDVAATDADDHVGPGLPDDDAGAPDSAPDGGEPEDATQIPALTVELGTALQGRVAELAAEAFAAGEFEDAAGFFERLARDTPRDAPGWYDASLMAGLARLRGGEPEPAAERLRPLSREDHPLRPFTRFALAQAELARGEAARALAVLDGEWPAPYAEQAVLLRAEALAAEARPGEAARVLEEARQADGGARARLLYARVRLEEIRDAGGEPDEAALGRCRAALAALRALRAERPGTGEGEEADRLLRAFVTLLPRRERAAFLDLTLADRIERVRRLVASYRYDSAQEEAERLLTDVGRDDPLRCAALQAAADAWYRAREYARAAQELGQALDACGGTDDWPAVAFRAAKARLNLDDRDGAAELFESVERAVPREALAADARLARAEIALDRDDVESFTALARSLVEDFAGTPQAEQAAWTLGLRALAEDRAADAEREFAALVRAGTAPAEPAQGGRSRYWHGVALAAAGRGDEASAEWREVVGHDPLTYYGLLAYGRLRLQDEAAARLRLSEALARRPAARPLRVEVPDVPLTRSDGFKRAIALLRLGLFDEADDEIGALRAGGDVPGEAVGALATLAQRVGAYKLGRRLGGVSQWPLGHEALDADSLPRWALAYPRGYESAVEKAAEEQRLPAAFLFGVIHEESGFEPRAYSSAHAVGLMQLLVGTAERFAPPAGVTGAISRRRLNRPSVNVAIGAAFLRFLADRYPERMVLLPAAYNAGEGRLDRWLAAHGDLPLDQFIEAIPYDSTRAYVMRVVSSWAVYEALYAPPDAAELLPAVDPTVTARP
ncbi:MAG: transglycosylase SLT domain-containing protein [Deltaproteobacteria bacterium]|nr:transglycosylase SLT domain-containing protein [Deltaproteobacteria bacterium]